MKTIPRLEDKKKRNRAIKNIKVCKNRLWKISTEIFSLDNDAYTYFSKFLHKNIWKLQENNFDTDESEYDSDATVDLEMKLPELPRVDSDSNLSFNSSYFESDDDEGCEEGRCLLLERSEAQGRYCCS